MYHTGMLVLVGTGWYVNVFVSAACVVSVRTRLSCAIIQQQQALQQPTAATGQQGRAEDADLSIQHARVSTGI